MPQSTTQDAFLPQIVECSDWGKITQEFDSLPAPEQSYHPDEELHGPTWIFRGLKSDDYNLQPSIERAADAHRMGWPTLEALLVGEFQAKTRMYMNPSDLPPRDEDEKISWLALMQHYGVPTRLLDFTYSPYAAMYFALRNRSEREKESEYVRVWAIDGEAVMQASLRHRWEASREEEVEPSGQPVSFFDIPMEDKVASDYKYRTVAISEGFRAVPMRRAWYYRKHGFVLFALPPIQNLRLSNQQGVFLLNCAEGLTFSDSLFKMMKPDDSWYRLFRIPASLLPEIEKKLFRMNIHELIMFPDMEGVAGFLDQKVRLH
jgi:hypothetical protein